MVLKLFWYIGLVLIGVLNKWVKLWKIRFFVIEINNVLWILKNIVEFGVFYKYI